MQGQDDVTQSRGYFMFDSRRECRFLAVLLGLVGLAWTGQAMATQTCQGSYATALLQPLPPHIVVDLDVHDRSPRNQNLAERFLAGVRNAGVAVGPQPTVVLHISTSLVGQASSTTNRGAVRNYPELSGLQGGQQPSLPALPPTGFTVRRSPPPPPLLIMRVDATPANSTRVAWVASIQCQMIGLDDGQRSEDLGRLVGSTLGERTERRPF